MKAPKATVLRRFLVEAVQSEQAPVADRALDGPEVLLQRMVTAGVDIAGQVNWGVQESGWQVGVHGGAAIGGSPSASVGFQGDGAVARDGRFGFAGAGISAEGKLTAERSPCQLFAVVRSCQPQRSVVFGHLRGTRWTGTATIQANAAAGIGDVDVRVPVNAVEDLPVRLAASLSFEVGATVALSGVTLEDAAWTHHASLLDPDLLVRFDVGLGRDGLLREVRDELERDGTRKATRLLRQWKRRYADPVPEVKALLEQLDQRYTDVADEEVARRLAQVGTWSAVLESYAAAPARTRALPFRVSVRSVQGGPHARFDGQIGVAVGIGAQAEASAQAEATASRVWLRVQIPEPDDGTCVTQRTVCTYSAVKLGAAALAATVRLDGKKEESIASPPAELGHHGLAYQSAVARWMHFRPSGGTLVPGTGYIRGTSIAMGRLARIVSELGAPGADPAPCGALAARLRVSDEQLATALRAPELADLFSDSELAKSTALLVEAAFAPPEAELGNLPVQPDRPGGGTRYAQDLKEWRQRLAPRDGPRGAHLTWIRIRHRLADVRDNTSTRFKLGLMGWMPTILTGGIELDAVERAGTHAVIDLYGCGFGPLDGVASSVVDPRRVVPVELHHR